MADVRRLLRAVGDSGKPNPLIEAYLQLTQQEAGEQELGGPRAPPYVPPDDDQNRYRLQPSESFPVMPPQPTPEAIDVDDLPGRLGSVEAPPPLRGVDAQPAQGPMPPPMLAQAPDVATPESISLEARPSILEGMGQTSDIRVEPGRDSGELRLEGYEGARGGTQGRSKWKDPSFYLGMGDRLAAGWAAPGPGGGFGEGWALTAGNERAQQQEAARAPYEHRQLEAKTRQAESDAQLAGYQADVFTEQAEFDRKMDEARQRYNESLTKNMEQVTRRSAQQQGIEASQLPVKQLESLLRMAKSMSEEKLIWARTDAITKGRDPYEIDKILSEIRSTDALTGQRTAAGELSDYRRQVDLPEGRRLQGRERQGRTRPQPHPSKLGIDLQREANLIREEYYHEARSAWRGTTPEEQKKSKADYDVKIRKLNEKYQKWIQASSEDFGFSEPEPASATRPTGMSVRQEASEASGAMRRRPVR